MHVGGGLETIEFGVQEPCLECTVQHKQDSDSNVSYDELCVIRDRGNSGIMQLLLALVTNPPIPPPLERMHTTHAGERVIMGSTRVYRLQREGSAREGGLRE